MTSTLQGGAGNRLLAALPKSDLRHFLGSCELVDLALAELLYSPWEPVHCAYFPTTSYVSILMPTSDSATFEVGLVGNEGMLGTALALNTDISAERATVHGAGLAFRMDAAALRRELRRSGALRGELDRYVHVRMGQLAQATVCAHFHLLEGRVARRLLTVQEHAHADTFNITQEILAAKLGVRRAGVTRAASALQQRGLIHYTRGNITVVDRRGLMVASCSCYKADRDSHSRIFGHLARESRAAI
jgi:CRP-like cAMP-binding protein